ncbi:hypothetical protein D3C77_792290 [compost metagenome]
MVGRRNTSVWIDAVSTSLNSPWFFQNSDVSVTSGSMITRNFSLARPLRTLLLLASAASGLKPWAM